MKKINLFFVYFISFLVMEFLYKIFLYDNIFRISIINMILFILCISLFLTFICKLFSEKVNKIIYIVIMSIICIWFSAQYVVKDYFDFYISLSTLTLADQVGEFASKGVIETFKRIPGILLLFTPFILSLIFIKKINFKKGSLIKEGILIVLVLVSYGLNLLALNIGKNKSYSSYELYYNYNNVSLNMESLGVLNTFFLDSTRVIFGFEEHISDTGGSLNDSSNVDNKNNNGDDDNLEVINYEYNNLDIDFNTLYNNETNNNIKKIHEYMSKDSGTLQNKYTGMFKNKNLILFMAESFNEIAVSKELTPTLYKLVNSGFHFNNFYTPTIYSTIGGEFQELSGLYAQSTGILSKFRSGNIYFPQGIGNEFKNLDYSVYAYHNNYASFQDRNKYLKSMGFDYFKACNTGMEKLINCNEWPRSDVDMINKTVNEYINNDYFMVFYATVSGHSGYTYQQNAMARKHRSEYEKFNLSYSEGPASYLAANMELDQALEALIKALDESGKLKDTVIALVGDHYPYELTLDEVNEVSSYEKDAIVTVNKSNFILWNSEMETVEVSKVGSQIDVIPTIYNLFGIKYDSRLFIGKDILSTEGGLAIFGNSSWVTDKGIYYSNSRKFVSNDGSTDNDDYIKMVNGIVNNKITMSKLIIENNYYKKVLD